MISHKLRLIWTYAIKDPHSAFVHSRNVIPNIMIVQETVRHYNRKPARPSCIIKLDIQKALILLTGIF